MQKKQDHILWTLESKKIDHEQIDIGDPNREKDRAFMRENVNDSGQKGKTALPPQIFNDETYIGVSSTPLSDSGVTTDLMPPAKAAKTWSEPPPSQQSTFTKVEV